MSKEAWLSAHEALVDEYLDAHPNATWDQAYNRTADGAWDRSRDMMADRIDAARDRMKDGQ